MKFLKQQKVIFDSTIYISSIVFGGNAFYLLDRTLAKDDFLICISNVLIEEVKRVLGEKFSIGNLEELDLIVSAVKVCQLTGDLEFPPDPNDAHLLDLAQTIHADYLVSGDFKHIVPLKNWKNTIILSPKDFITILNS